MKYHYTILVPQELTFDAEYRRCPYCKQKIQKHIVCEGARWHVLSYGSILGATCGEPDCERNHGFGKCQVPKKEEK